METTLSYIEAVKMKETSYLIFRAALFETMKHEMKSGPNT